MLRRRTIDAQLHFNSCSIAVQLSFNRDSIEHELSINCKKLTFNGLQNTFQKHRFGMVKT